MTSDHAVPRLGAFPPTHISLNSHGPRSQVAVEITNNYLTGEFVRQSAVPPADLDVCRQYFVLPRQPGQVEDAARHLNEDGIVVLSAPRGTGRRTVALKLLTDRAVTNIVDLEPEWSKPDVKLLPSEPAGYVLRLAGLSTSEHRVDFTRELLRFGREGRLDGRYLVVLVTPPDWTGEWAGELPTVKLTPPDARTLVTQELKQAKAFDQLRLLEHESLRNVWSSNPPAAEAVRLAGKLERATEQELSKLIDEFTGWHDYIDGLFQDSGDKQGLAISDRATLWAGSLLYRGHYKTVLNAANDLLDELGVQQSIAQIMAGPTSTARLQDAHLKRDGNQVIYESPRANLAAAVLRHLWDEFPMSREQVVAWAVKVASAAATPDEDAAIAISSLVQLAVDCREGDIVNRVGNALAAHRRSIVVDGLSKAALDPELGDYVRHRLLQWSHGTGDLTKLAAAVCGNRLGTERPDIALTRLRWAAGGLVTGPDAAVVIDAFRHLVVAKPQEVEQAIRSWLRGTKSQAESDRAVLALALSDEGSLKLIDLARDPHFRQLLVDSFQRLLVGDTAELTTACVDRWEVLVAEGRVSEAELRPLLIDFYRPDLQRLMASKFLPSGVQLESTLRGRALNEFLEDNSRRRTEPHGG